MNIKKIIVVIILVLMVLSGVTFFYLKSQKVISSTLGDISVGTFNYLRFSLYYNIENKEDVIDKIQWEEARLILADRYDLKQEPAYPRLLKIGRRARINRAAVQLWKIKLGKDFTWDDMLSHYQVRFENAVDLIVPQLEKSGSQVKVKDDTVVIGSWKGGEITLAMLHSVMLPTEWEHLKGFDRVPMREAVDENIKRWMSVIGNQEVINILQPNRKELERFDQAYVADRYLSAKYALAKEGIFPAKKINIKLRPTQVFDHFFKTIHRFLMVERTKVQYTMVKDQPVAEKFLEGLQKGYSFKIMTAQYAQNKSFIKTAHPHWIAGYDMNLPLLERENRSFTDKLLLDFAQRNITKTTPWYGVGEGVYIIHVIEIIREDKHIDFKDFREEVTIDLSNQILKKEYDLDIKETMRLNKFKVRPQHIPLLKVNKNGLWKF